MSARAPRTGLRPGRCALRFAGRGSRARPDATRSRSWIRAGSRIAAHRRIDSSIRARRASIRAGALGSLYRVATPPGPQTCREGT
jgi:hypothetical protein